jgi:thiol-disulfide isomerase/thioredoxin
MISTSVRIPLLRMPAILVMLATLVIAADQPGIRAPLVPQNERQPAADFVLRDASGKTAKLSDYAGKVVLLDFWATWCTGCKKEIPWFSEFQKKYGAEGFAMVAFRWTTVVGRFSSRSSLMPRFPTGCYSAMIPWPSATESRTCRTHF